MRSRVVGLSLALVAASAPAMAHHAVQAQFDVETEITVDARLLGIDWVNPHAWWHWEVTNADGTVSNLSTETPGPAGLRRVGLADRRLFTIGESYRVKYNPDRNPDQRLGFTTSITMPNGRLIVLGFDQL